MNSIVNSTPWGPKSFESLHVDITSANVTISLVLVYRPQEKSTGYPFSFFLDEFATLSDCYLTKPFPLLITGDFNIHVDDKSDYNAIAFDNLVTTSGLSQHITTATHKKGHTLDLFITRSSDATIFNNLKVIDPCIADHFAITCTLNLKKPPDPTKHIITRHLNAIDIDAFCEDIVKSNLYNSSQATPFCSLEDQAKVYSDTLSAILDKHAPAKKRTVKIRPDKSWFNDEIRDEKKKRRQLENKWRKSRLEIDRQLYCEQKQKVNCLINKAKYDHYNQLFTEHAKDQKRLFQIADKLLHRQKASPLPSSESDLTLANDFSSFFINKIKNICDNFPNNVNIDTLKTSGNISLPKHKFTCFEPATEEEIHEILSQSPSKSCELDPIPTSLLKKCSHAIVPPLTRIINTSLDTGIVPNSFKVAHVRPLLKKPSLDKNVFKNYRPVSNLNFLGKTLERVVMSRVNVFLNENDLFDKNQSAYRPAHSTESALLCVHNDILQAMNKGQITLLVLLDLSAAFDTVDHSIFLNRLKSRIGIDGTALSWFQSYLTNRSQVVCINDAVSYPVTLTFGLPQGSVIGPSGFSLLYTLPLGDIIRNHGLKYHFYADDTQLFLSFDPTQENAESALQRIETCIDEIRQWMSQNFLKLNDDKTEFIIIGSHFQRSKVHIPHIRVGDVNITPGDSVRNLGAMFDSQFSMTDHVTHIAKSARFSLRNIGRIRKHLNRQVAEMLVHAFVTSKLDMANSLLYGLPDAQLCRLQRLQNNAARIITLTKTRDHITPVLQDLHWLPIEQRIVYKIALFVFKIVNDTMPAPHYLCDLVEIHRPRRMLRSSNQLLLTEHRSFNQWGDRSFKIAAAKVWNNIPTNLRFSPTLTTFRTGLKTHLYNIAYL